MEKNFLMLALTEASRRRGFTSPNPAVGAVVVRDGEILSRGSHWAAGFPHAEVDALKKVEDAKGATIYVTLEPCCHEGRTPPCTELLIARQIAKVVFAYRDPNPLVFGNGEAQLKAHGIEVVHFPVAEIDQFYKSYAHWTQSKMPYVTAKLALTLDGKIAGCEGQRLFISGPEANQLTHERRKNSDAILTTVSTVFHDNPQLNARLNNEIYTKPVFVIDRELSLPLDSRLWKTAESLTLFHSARVGPSKIEELTHLGAVCIPVGESEEGLALAEVVAKIGLLGKHDLWVEAGGKLFHSLLKQRLLNEALIYVAAKWFGPGGTSAFSEAVDFSSAKETRWRGLGSDALCELRWQ